MILRISAMQNPYLLPLSLEHCPSSVRHQVLNRNVFSFNKNSQRKDVIKFRINVISLHVCKKKNVSTQISD